jgi:hypothetical protein
MHTTITLKQDTLYFAYAPELDMAAYGGIRKNSTTPGSV